MKNWEVLLDRDIIYLLIGDSTIINGLFLDYKMPYMSGPDICNFGSRLGLERNYWESDKLSRWMYMENILKYVIENDKVNFFFKEFLKLNRFKKIEKSVEYSTINELYYDLVHNLMNRINEILFFENCHIEYDLNTYQFNLIFDDDNVVLETDSIDNIDKNYIKRLNMEISKTIKDGDYESSITKSRTLLEEIIIYGIEMKNETPESKGKINELYKQFKNLYNMHIDVKMNKEIKQLLSGLENIISAISTIRNENSDSHGAGSRRVRIERQYAKLFSNSAQTMGEFLLSVIEEEMKSNLYEE